MFKFSRRMLTLLLGCFALGSMPLVAHANVITFNTASFGLLSTPTAEGVFTYSTFSGGVFRDTGGNGDYFDMEGDSVLGGGVLRIVRNDVAGGLFTFNGSDVAFQFNSAVSIGFEGFLGGISQGSDSFLTTANSTYTTYGSLVLLGKQIDELRVTLDASLTPASATNIDNVSLTPLAAIPEPEIYAMLGIGLGLLGWTRGKQRSKEAAAA